MSTTRFEKACSKLTCFGLLFAFCREYVGRTGLGSGVLLGFGSWMAKFLEKAEMNKVTAFLSTFIQQIAKFHGGVEKQNSTE